MCPRLVAVTLGTNGPPHMVGKTASVKIVYLTCFQYLTIPSIHFDLFFLNKKNYEFSDISVWIAILGNYLPRNHGYYSHDIEARNNEGWSDILVRALPAGSHLFDMRPPPFFTIQCKKVKYEARDSGWRGAKLQLQRYFRGIYVQARQQEMARCRRISFCSSRFEHYSCSVASSSLIPQSHHPTSWLSPKNSRQSTSPACRT